MWVFVVFLGAVAAGAWFESKSDPAGRIVAFLFAALFILAIWFMIKRAPAPRPKVNLRDEISRIRQASETNCEICKGSLVIGERYICSNCGVERAVLTA
jgi:hypothetical protein